MKSVTVKNWKSSINCREKELLMYYKGSESLMQVFFFFNLEIILISLWTMSLKAANLQNPQHFIANFIKRKVNWSRGKSCWKVWRLRFNDLSAVYLVLHALSCPYLVFNQFRFQLHVYNREDREGVLGYGIWSHHSSQVYSITQLPEELIKGAKAVILERLSYDWRSAELTMANGTEKVSWVLL